MEWGRGEWSLESPPPEVFPFPSSTPCSLSSPPPNTHLDAPSFLRVGNDSICDFSFWSYIVVIAEISFRILTHTPEGAKLPLPMNTSQSLIYSLLSVSCE